MNYCKDFVEQAKATDMETTRDMDAYAAEVIDWLYAEMVDKTGRVEGQDNFAYACEILDVDQHEPLMNIRGAYLRHAALLRDFCMVLRHPKVALLEPQHKWDGCEPPEWASARDRMNRVMSGLNSMYSIVYHTRWMDDVADQGHSVPFWEALINCPPVKEDEQKEYGDQQKLVLYALHMLTLRNARRFDDWVMVPKITRTGYDSTAYERLCPIEDFLPQYIDKERDAQMWTIMTSSSRVLDFTTRILTRFLHREFPDLVRSRTTFAFNNGVYYAHDNTFRAYKAADRRMSKYLSLRGMTEEDFRDLQRTHADMEESYAYSQWDFTGQQGDTPSSASRTPSRNEQVQQQKLGLLHDDGSIGKPSACVYHDMDFKITQCENPMHIATPCLDKILDAQQLGEGPDGPNVKSWICALLGRMLYDVGQHDDWQLAPFIKGVAGTGKSTLLRLMREFYANEDVGVMSNNIEGTFGLAALYKKLIVLCFEMRADFGLDQAELQSLMSGEPMSIKVKFKTAIPCLIWTAPIAAAGNMTADWGDSSGAMTRRWALIEFPIPITKGDPKLMQNLRRELPAVLAKCNRCYLEKLRLHAHMNPWDRRDGQPICLPQYFHDQAEKLGRSLNSLDAFITNSGMVVRRTEDDAEEPYMPWLTFTEQYNAYCKNMNQKPMRLGNEDNYCMLFKKLGLRREEAEMQDYTAPGFPIKKQFWVFGCRMINAGAMDDDGDTSL